MRTRLITLRVASTAIFFFLIDAYAAEKVPPLKEKKAPSYSFGLRTRYAQKDGNPAPNQYTLPNLTGGKVPNKYSSSAYSLTGRSKIGSFHEDMQKVRHIERRSFALFFFSCNFICQAINYSWHGNLYQLPISAIFSSESIFKSVVEREKTETGLGIS